MNVGPSPRAGTRYHVTLRAWLTASVLLAGGPAYAASNEERVDPAGLEFFEKKVRPVLAEHCFTCHSARAEKLRGGLLLDSREAMIRGGATGAAVVPGEPEESLLIAAVRQSDPDLKMPPRGKLSDAQVADLEAWVKMGAPAPREGPAAASAPRPDVDLARARDFWSFRPVGVPTLPEVRDAGWSRTPIDRFILAGLERHAMHPAAPAGRRTWLRRVTFDLTGLPPTPEEVATFLADHSPGAEAAVVERLLASPHYGERWGRHWLDVVRYADTSGCNADVPVADAWRYRNYVVDAFNRDKPYDQFVREQVAGDLLPADSERARHEQVIATGYLATARRYSSLNEEFHLTIEDAIDNLGKAFLGLSISCARCHDHKFDPIPTTDYYALYGIFDSTRFAFPGTEIPRHSRDMVPLLPPDETRKLAPYFAKMDALDREIKEQYGLKAALDTGKARDAAERAWKKAVEERDALIRSGPAFPRAFAVAEGTPHDARVQKKGDPANLGDAVPRRFLSVLGGEPVPSVEPGSGRRQLAGWLTAPGNPLLARVMVNRIWQHHFGQGLVRTPDDFGARGAPPTHPELLDDLATRFVQSGWSVKAMHRLIVLSAAYRMSSTDDPRALVADPGNERLWRFNRRRLDAEEVRDAMLAIAGALDRSPGGPHPFKPEWEWRYTQHNPFLADFETDRRGIYLVQQRIRKQPFLEVFDGADTNSATGKRAMSTTALQALFAMNDRFAHTQADRFAARVLAARAEIKERIALAYELAFARPPEDEEIELGAEFLSRSAEHLRQLPGHEADAERAAWAGYARVLLSSNEFMFLD